MNSAEKSKRRFWRIHLSTAVILMLSAGVLLWRCSLPMYADDLQPSILDNGELRPLIGEGGIQFGYLQYGWPRWGYRTQGCFVSENLNSSVTSMLDARGVSIVDYTSRIRSAPNYVPGKGIVWPSEGDFREFNTAGILIDVAVALAILAALATLLEFLIRRRVSTNLNKM